MSRKFPDFSRTEIVDHCREWAQNLRVKELDYDTINQTSALIAIDELTYSIRLQDWIDHPANHDLRWIVKAAHAVNTDHRNSSRWLTLFNLIDSLKREGEEYVDLPDSVSAYFGINPKVKYPDTTALSDIQDTIQKARGKLHEYARREVIAHCKAWAESARFEYLEIVTGDRQNAQRSADILIYPISIQGWIDWHTEPKLAEIIKLGEELSQNHTNPAKWEKLIKLIDTL